MKLLLLLSIAVASLSLQSCSGCKFTNTPVTPTPDNPYGLPNATQDGEGVFACRINGINAIAKDDILHMMGGVEKDTIAVKGSFTIGSFFATIYLGIQNNAKANITYNFSDTAHTYGFFVTDSTCQTISNVTTVKPQIGNIIFSKIDTTHTFKILSGTFNMKIPITGCDTLNVTDGRFDIGFN